MFHLSNTFGPPAYCHVHCRKPTLQNLWQQLCIHWSHKISSASDLWVLQFISIRHGPQLFIIWALVVFGQNPINSNFTPNPHNLYSGWYTRNPGNCARWNANGTISWHGCVVYGRYGVIMYNIFNAMPKPVCKSVCNYHAPKHEVRPTLRNC